MSLNVELLESSFKLVAPNAEALADHFYGRLFRLHPELRSMFPEALDEQKKKLIASLAMVVGSLRNPDTLVAAVRALGLRHIDYGVKREQYPVVGENLLASLEAVAGDAWNDELAAAWTDAYNAIQSIIFDALDDAKQAA